MQDKPKLMPAEKPIVEKCRSCRAEVVWIRKPNSPSRMICDATPESIRRRVEDLPFENDVEGLQTHLLSCPDWQRWSRRYQEEQQGGK